MKSIHVHSPQYITQRLYSLKFNYFFTNIILNQLQMPHNNCIILNCISVFDKIRQDI